jgi:choline dehydrogenase-like flavoprotein
MGTDPKQSVVDANCKVHGLANLYCAGSSCYTTAAAVNPTLTLVALTLRLSDHLKETARQNVV